MESHGRILRELTEKEFHRQQGFVVRGVSGHWMLFSSAALMLLTGAANIRRQAQQMPAAVPSPGAPEEG